MSSPLSGRGGAAIMAAADGKSSVQAGAGGTDLHNCQPLPASFWQSVTDDNWQLVKANVRSATLPFAEVEHLFATTDFGCRMCTMANRVAFEDLLRSSKFGNTDVAVREVLPVCLCVCVSVCLCLCLSRFLCCVCVW